MSHVIVALGCFDIRPYLTALKNPNFSCVMKAKKQDQKSVCPSSQNDCMPNHIYVKGTESSILKVNMVNCSFAFIKQCHY